VNVKKTISNLFDDKVFLGSALLGALLLVAACFLMWQKFVVDARSEAVNFHYGLNMKIAASHVDSYLDRYQQQLDLLSERPSLAQQFNQSNQQALNRLEADASAGIAEAQAVFLVDPALQRHKNDLGFAAMHMVRQTIAGGAVMPRAVKIDQQWRILISRAVTSSTDENAEQIVGVILLQLPVQGLEKALSNIDITNGQLELQQLVPNRSNIVLLSLGNPENSSDSSGYKAEIFDTENTLWKISFMPSQALINKINNQLPPFWLYSAAAILGTFIAFFLLAVARVKRKKTITAIFIENHNAEDALFAAAIDTFDRPADLQPIDGDIELPLEEPQPYGEPQLNEGPQRDEEPEPIQELQKIEQSELEPQPGEEPQLGEKPQLGEEPQPSEKPQPTEEVDPALETSLLESETEQPPKIVPAPELALDSDHGVEADLNAEDAAAPDHEANPDSELKSEPALLTEIPNDLDDPNFRLAEVVFRDYDIRGIAGTEITPEFASRLGKTLGSIILKNGHTAIYIGRDGRLSSPQLTEALQAGLLSTGCNVIDLGEITTPVLNFAVHHCGQSSCGIMVTASHNPARYNGFKIIIKGQVIAGPTLQLLKPMMTEANFTLSSERQKFHRDIVPQYVRHIVEESSIDRSFKIVVDSGNSVAGPVALKLFDSLGCMAFPMFCEVDGSFPNHEPNPADEKNLQGLIERVKEVNADLGLAFDGDGDRVVVISGSGEIIWPDRLMMIFARDILARNPGADIVFDVKSSKRLADIVRENSGRPVMCKTGHAHVRKAVQHNHAPLGGEFSGHIFFNDRWKGFDDGLYAAVRLLEILCDQDKSIDNLVGEFKSSSYTPEILIPMDELEKFSLIDTLVVGCQFSGAQVITLDGLRVEYPKGWGLIRASNTSASLTLRFEADDDESLEQIKQSFRTELSPFINQIEEFI
jgi:phosphomannomutase/phosphoglucomutase